MKTNLIYVVLLLSITNFYAQIVRNPAKGSVYENQKESQMKEKQERESLKGSKLEQSESKFERDERYREAVDKANNKANIDSMALEKPFYESFLSGSELNLDMFVTDTSSIKKPSNTPKSRKELTNMMAVTKKFDGSLKSGIEVPGFGGLKLEKEDSNLNAYYIESKIVGDKVYGIGYSVHYLFKKVKRGLSLNNLPAICASVTLDNGKTEVYYSIKSYGMKGKPLTKYFKPVVNKPFDVEGYAIMQSSIDGIHAVMGDETLGNAIDYEPQEISFLKPADLR